MNPRTVAAAALALAVMLCGCGPSQSEDRLVASARAYLDKKDTAGAVIQLKTLLQQHPNSALGRLMIGRTMADSGDPVAAVNEVAPDLARAMLMIGDHARVLSQYKHTRLQSAKAVADLSTSLAIAYALKNDLAKAAESSKEALLAQPGYAPALIVQARLKAADKDVDSALALADDVLAREPGNERAGLLKAELLLGGKRDVDGALGALRKVLAAHPKSVHAHVAVIGIFKQSGKADDAKAQLADLKKAAPAHPDTLHLDAQQKFAERDYKGTLEITDRLLQGMPNNPSVLFLAGAATHQMNSFVQAEGHLSKALKVAPGFVAARHLLAQTYLQTGEPTKAIETLEPITASDKADGVSLALSAEAHLAAGDAKRADDAFQRAERAAPQDPRVRTSVALGQMARGNTSEAIGELETIAASDKGTRADLALITAKLRANDLKGALAAVEGLQAKVPESPLPYLLRGRILQAKKDAAGAAAAFDGALKKDPKYFPAVAGLASLDIAAGKPEQAKKRFADLLRADPKSYRAHVALAEMAERAGARPQEVAQELAAAVRSDPTQPAPRLLLIEQLWRVGDTQAALVAAQDAAAALPTDITIQEKLGRAQLAAADAQRAISTFTRLASQQPKAPMLQLWLAEAHAANRDLEAAKRALQSALELQADMPQAQRGLASIAMAQKRPSEALAIARQVQKVHPQDPTGHALEGEILRVQSDWPGAIAAHRKALALARNTDGVIRLHQTYMTAGQTGEADKLAAAWRQEHPNDIAFRLHLGDVAVAQKDWATADSHYAAVVQAQPWNALALNNVAWLMVQQGKPGAVEVAERANELMPGRAHLLDTLASALAADGKLPKAIETQKLAITRQPNNPDLNLNLARLYIKAGEKAQARVELESLAKLGDKFAAKGEVSTLLESLH
jgi:putative PEP-CTERM system TPR-repeat lipoprotein